ncbi:MAG: hypothetical protein L0Z50_22015 [Verrucomicrobiales bacterium]|nr:hypothetical protein [Verrucomicrobiales bacterium]
MKTTSLLQRGVLGALLVVSGLTSACRPEPTNAVGVIRLHDIFSPEDIKGRLTKEELKVKPTVWKFDGSEFAPSITNDAPITLGWRAGPGSSPLEIRDGRLVGKSTNAFPIIYVERASGTDDLDLLHSIEV